MMLKPNGALPDPGAHALGSARPIRVALWGPGYTGRQVLRELIRRPEFEVVGCLARSERHSGADVGALCGEAETGVTVTTDRDAFTALEADIVVHTTRFIPGDDATDDGVVALLRSGKNVVSSMAYHFPWQRGGRHLEVLEAACAAGGTTLFGTGVHPGWVIERIVPTLASACVSVDAIEIAETVDLAHHSGDAIAGMGFGRPPHTLGSTKRKAIFSRYYFDSLAYLSHVLDLGVDSLTSDIRYLPARRHMTAAAVDIEEGTVGAIVGTWTGSRGGEAVLTLHERLYVDPALIDDVAITSPDFYDIAISGRPLGVRTRIDLAVTDRRDVYGVDGAQCGANLATAVQLVLTIPAVIAAPPGILLPDLFAHPRADLRTMPAPKARPAPIPEVIL